MVFYTCCFLKDKDVLAGGIFVRWFDLEDGILGRNGSGWIRCFLKYREVSVCL